MNDSRHRNLDTSSFTPMSGKKTYPGAVFILHTNATCVVSRFEMKMDIFGAHVRLFKLSEYTLFNSI